MAMRRGFGDIQAAQFMYRIPRNNGPYVAVSRVLTTSGHGGEFTQPRACSFAELFTDKSKNTEGRFHELALAARGSQDAGSRNLASLFYMSSVSTSFSAGRACMFLAVPQALSTDREIVVETVRGRSVDPRSPHLKTPLMDAQPTGLTLPLQSRCYSEQATVT